MVIIAVTSLMCLTDVYISCVSYAHHVAPKNKWIALVSTKVETDNPEAELQPGINLLGKVDEM